MKKSNQLEITEHPSIKIEMPDGCFLSARVWMPKNANARPVPAILEHLPYRKRDGTAHRDNLNHTWFAKNGYACVRTDIRGNGDSEGLMADEYLQQELDDAISVIRWVVKQPWCSGSVGMMGISWGGFNSLQVASIAPKELKALITVCSSVDRFADDIHYKGGCLLSANFTWAGRMLSYSSRPPDPMIFGSGWKTEWLKRLNNLPLLADIWLSQQKRSRYWRHGSVCEDYESIKAAVLAVGGFHDGYRNTVLKLVLNLSSPVKGIMGPWNHRYPHLAEPEPRIGFLQEALRWWDRWLKDINNGCDTDDDYKVFVMDSIKPARRLEKRPGKWRNFSKHQLNSPNIKKLGLGFGTLGESESLSVACIELKNSSNVGSQAGEFFPYNFGPELPADQRSDDEKSTCFDGEFSTEDVCIVGSPTLEISVSSDKPLAQLAVRLCDVRPDGTSALITHGFQNLTMARSFEEPDKLAAGKKIDVEIQLDQTAYHLPIGHKLRLAISNSYWPFIWPSPEITKINIYRGILNLPFVNDNNKIDANIFDSPVSGDPLKCKVKRSPSSTRESFFDENSGQRILEVKHDSGCTVDLEHGLETDSGVVERWTSIGNDPLSAQIDIKWYQILKRDNWHVHTESKFNVTCDGDFFYLKGAVIAWEDSKKVFSRTFNENISREFV